MAERHGPATIGAPHVRDAQSVASMTSCLLVALLPCLLVGLWNTGRQAFTGLSSLPPGETTGWRLALFHRLELEQAAGWAATLALGALHVLPLLVVAIAAALAWEHLFARLRRRQAGEGAAAAAVIFTLLLPAATPLPEAAFGMSFGMVFGRLIFGGVGRTFLHPAVVGLAFLAVSRTSPPPGAALFPGLRGYTGTDAFAQAAARGPSALGESGLEWLDAFLGMEPARIGESSVIACLLGAAWLVHRRAASWQVMAGALIGAVAASVLWNVVERPAAAPALPAHWHLVLGGFAFVAVFVATDPPSTGSTPAGRWIAGLLVGTLVVILRLGHPDHPDGVIPAVLLASVAAPLIDHAVTRWAVRRRRRRSASALAGLQERTARG